MSPVFQKQTLGETTVHKTNGSNHCPTRKTIKSCTKIYKTPDQKFAYMKKTKDIPENTQTGTTPKATQKNLLWTDPQGATTLKLMYRVFNALNVPCTEPHVTSESCGLGAGAGRWGADSVCYEGRIGLPWWLDGPPHISEDLQQGKRQTKKNCGNNIMYACMCQKHCTLTVGTLVRHSQQDPAAHTASQPGLHYLH